MWAVLLVIPIELCCACVFCESWNVRKVPQRMRVVSLFCARLRSKLGMAISSSASVSGSTALKSSDAVLTTLSLREVMRCPPWLRESGMQLMETVLR